MTAQRLMKNSHNSAKKDIQIQKFKYKTPKLWNKAPLSTLHLKKGTLGTMSLKMYT